MHIMSHNPVDPERSLLRQSAEVPVREGVVLRRFTANDSSAYFSLIDANRDHLSQHGDDTAQKYPTLESVEERMKFEKVGEYRFGIWSGDTLMGLVKLTGIGVTAEIGYLLGEEYAGHGIMTDAARAALEYAIVTIGYEEVVAWVEETNMKSSSVLSRLGFECMGPEYDRIRSIEGVIYVDELHSFTTDRPTSQSIVS